MIPILEFSKDSRISLTQHYEGEWNVAVFHFLESGELTIRTRIVLGEMTAPFWCLPGLFWGDNLEDSTPSLYPRFDARCEKAAAFRSNFWEANIERLTQPLVTTHDGAKWHILEVEPYVEWEDSWLPVSLGFALRDGIAELRCSLPAADEPYEHVGHGYCEPVVRKISAATGSQITLRYRFHTLAGDHYALTRFLRDRYQAAAANRLPAELLPTPDLLARATRNGLMNWHYSPATNSFKYTVAYDRIGQQLAECAGCSLDSTQLFLGWVSGWVVFEPLLDYAKEVNDPSAREAVVKVWSALESSVTSPSGFWWARHMPEPRAASGEPLRSFFQPAFDHRWDGGWMPQPTQLHLRTIGDAVLRAARSLEKHADLLPFADSLREQILSQAEKMAEFARHSPRLPLVVDALTGQPHPFHGTASMIWISVWIQLRRMGLWQDDEVIHRGADHYRDAVATGLLHGAPEDVGECLTSEDAYIALNAYADLYETYGKPADLVSATQAATWIYLWRRSFDARLSRRTLVGRYGLRSRGADLASAKNNHLHIYGIDAEVSLRKLSLWTGDDSWKDMAEDHWAFAAQLASVEDGQFNGYEGMVTEQFYFINWAPLGNSVHRFEKDTSRTAWDVGPHFRNQGNLAGFSTAWCVAFILSGALRRHSTESAAPDTQGLQKFHK